MLQDVIHALSTGRALDLGEISGVIEALIDEAVSTPLKADFLVALAQKGETPAEIAEFANQLLKRSVHVPLSPGVRQEEILDVCGTGGDRLNTFNISTTVALLAAAGGVRVAKHGNRAITSQVGSADVLDALGIPVNLSPASAAESLEKLHFAFFFAPQYHPAFKHIAPARKLCNERGQRTIFNFLGPLLNPVRPTAQLLGVSRAELCGPLAEVLRALGIRRAMVVCSETPEGILDELSCIGPNHISETYHDRGIAHSVVTARELGLPSASLRDLQGVDRASSAKVVRDILTGDERGPKRGAVLLNAGAAFFVAGKTRSILDGIAYGAEVIDSGQAARRLEQLRTSGDSGRGGCRMGAT